MRRLGSSAEPLAVYIRFSFLMFMATLTIMLAVNEHINERQGVTIIAFMLGITIAGIPYLCWMHS